MSPVEDSAGHRARPAESDIASRVKDVICDQFEVSREQLGANASLIDDLHADSLKLVELTLALEQEFEITIPEGEGEKIKTVGDLIAYIEARIERDRGARDRRSPPPAAHDQGAR
jgi:acyl carrier protein